MPDKPFRLRVLENLTGVVQGVTPGNGFTYDLSESTFRGRVLFGEGDPLPMVVVLEAPVPEELIDSPHGSAYGAGYWDILLQGFIEDDHDNPTDPAHYLLADVKKALGKERIRGQRDFDLLGFKEVEDIRIGHGLVRPPGDGISDVAHFWLRIGIKLVEDNSQPFA